MKTDSSKQKIEIAINAMNALIEKDAWQSSNFLKMLNKNLREARDHFIEQVNGSNEVKTKISSTLANRVALRAGQQEVYVSLYSIDGGNLQSWERILHNLPHQMISRPIYADESYIKSMISNKENKNNEAYVSIYISQADLLPMQVEKVPMDKLGQPMLMLKDNALKLQNINLFVHQSGIYHYENGRLTKKTMS
jgi:intracellular multiplication protein IcmQ